MALQNFTSCRRLMPLRASTVLTSVSGDKTSGNDMANLLALLADLLIGGTASEPNQPFIQADAGGAGCFDNFDFWIDPPRVFDRQLRIEGHVRQQIQSCSRSSAPLCGKCPDI